MLTPASTWTAISGFKVGDKIASASGKPITITVIETDSTQREVYNLTVAEDHSYAVGELGLWAHNVHGSSHLSQKLVYLYQLFDGSGKFQQWGITDDLERREKQHDKEFPNCKVRRVH